MSDRRVVPFRTPEDAPAPYLGVPEVAEHLGCSERHVYNLAKRGELPHYRLGSLYRFRLDEIDAHMAKHRQGPEV